MAKNRCPRILMIEKLVEEEMNANAQWPKGEVPDILGKVESGEGNGEGKMRKCRLTSA